MIKKSGVLVLVFSLLIIAGCGGVDRDNTPLNWRTGNQGLEMRFQQGSPPNSVYDGDKVDIGLDLWNRGAEPLTGDIYLTGFDPSIFQGIPNYLGPFSIIQAKTRYNDEGGYGVARATGRVRIPEGVDVFDTNINAVACYDYETLAAIQICIDPEPNKNDNTDPCRPGAYSVGTQAAPLAITNVDVDSTPSRTIFRINIANVGGGQILDEAVIHRCMESDVIYADANWVDLIEATVGNAYALQCEPPNPIKLPDGSGMATCWMDNPPGTTAYTTTLNLRIRYGYKQTVTTNVQVRNTI